VPLEHEALTEKIIGAAIEVHRGLGPGFLESIYESALALELRTREIPFQRQLLIPILYRGVEVGLHRLDFFIAEEIVVELKAIRDLEDIHFAVVKSYLRAMGRSHGLILNFSKPTLEIKRVIATVAPTR
jgi:GxxExxY protein